MNGCKALLNGRLFDDEFTVRGQGQQRRMNYVLIHGPCHSLGKSLGRCFEEYLGWMEI